MPRDLGDVLHYFLPAPEIGEPEASEASLRVDDEVRALPRLVVPVGERDLVRAALAWNLTVEIARLGACATLVTARGPDTASLWPEAGRGPVGAEVVHTPAHDLGDLHRASLDAAVARSAEADEGGVVVVCAPPEWLRAPGDGAGLLRWVLLLSTADRRELMETYAQAKPLLRGDFDGLASAPASLPRVGVTIHGARRVADAERAFDHLAGVASRHLGRTPVSYGLLVDDLHVYRAIVARRPIGLEHPQAPAARALRDVAQLVLEDARKSAVV
ncbi:MAG: MinD/ParA family ATP-binding protein [Myxococcota bacterium]